MMCRPTPRYNGPGARVARIPAAERRRWAAIEKRMKSTVARLGTIVAVLMITMPLAASAQPAARVYRIGILGDKASDANETRLWQAFRAGLQEHGWNEGVNIRIEAR